MGWLKKSSHKNKHGITKFTFQSYFLGMLARRLLLIFCLKKTGGGGGESKLSLKTPKLSPYYSIFIKKIIIFLVSHDLTNRCVPSWTAALVKTWKYGRIWPSNKLNNYFVFSKKWWHAPVHAILVHMLHAEGARIQFILFRSVSFTSVSFSLKLISTRMKRNETERKWIMINPLTDTI